jgi:cyanophycin synthetase
VLEEQGFTPDSVPPAQTVVLIRRNANLSTGGTATDVTDDVHPEVAARAITAAQVVGLDIAGVDVVAGDVGKPLEQQRAAVVEVNAAPGLRMHLAPSKGKPRPVGDAIVDLLFPAGAHGRIPVVGVTGVNGKTTVTRCIAHILKGTGRFVGFACTDGIYLDERRIDSGDCSGPKSAQCLLSNPLVEMAVLETARGGILREGLGFDRCDVAVVTNIGSGDHLGLSGIETLEQLAAVKRVLVEAVAPTGTAVLNADEPLVASMAQKCPGSVLYFAMSGDHPLLQEHRAQGARAVFVRDNSIVLAAGEQETVLMPLDHVPLTHGGRIPFQVENTLAAVGAAWAMCLPLEMMATRIDCFTANLNQVPGRFNVIDFNGATIIVDYGHNVSSLEALIRAIERYPHPQRTAVYSTAGDRRDCDIIRQGELLGEAFDRVILYEDHYRRGRAEGEIIGLFRQGLAAGRHVKEILEFRGSLNAVQAALDAVRPGELLLVQADEIDETVNFVSKYFAAFTARNTPAEPNRPAIAALMPALPQRSSL